MMQKKSLVTRPTESTSSLPHPRLIQPLKELPPPEQLFKDKFLVKACQTKAGTAILEKTDEEYIIEQKLLCTVTFNLPAVDTPVHKPNDVGVNSMAYDTLKMKNMSVIDSISTNLKPTVLCAAKPVPKVSLSLCFAFSLCHFLSVSDSHTLSLFLCFYLLHTLSLFLFVSSLFFSLSLACSIFFLLVCLRFEDDMSVFVCASAFVSRCASVSLSLSLCLHFCIVWYSTLVWMLCCHVVSLYPFNSLTLMRSFARITYHTHRQVRVKAMQSFWDKSRSWPSGMWFV